MEIKGTIIGEAEADDRIRAVVLNGSRANDAVKPDKYQDYDIVFFVYDLPGFTSNHNWTEFLGDKLLMQLPDEMEIGIDEAKETFTYLMVFEDGVRIDLTLFPIDGFMTSYTHDSLTKLWMDKDGLFDDIPDSNDIDYHVRKPSEKEFQDVCNEFWWVSHYVAKALVRNEIIHAKSLMEGPLRNMFNRVIEIYAGMTKGFSISVGKGLKNIPYLLSEDAYGQILLTYPNHHPDNIVDSMKKMFHIFSRYARKIATELNYDYMEREEHNAIYYFNTFLKDKI